jgi:hypothetical protein
MRLIDADALENICAKNSITDKVTVGEKTVLQHLKDAPTIDAVPVVRCKECKYAMVNEHHPNKPLICGMTRMCGTTPPEWFCADGERRSE